MSHIWNKLLLKVRESLTSKLFMFKEVVISLNGTLPVIIFTVYQR